MRGSNYKLIQTDVVSVDESGKDMHPFWLYFYDSKREKSFVRHTRDTFQSHVRTGMGIGISLWTCIIVVVWVIDHPMKDVVTASLWIVPFGQSLLLAGTFTSLMHRSHVAPTLIQTIYLFTTNVAHLRAMSMMANAKILLHETALPTLQNDQGTHNALVSLILDKFMLQVRNTETISSIHHRP